MQLVLQPCGDPKAFNHYQDTINTPVSIASILPFLTPIERDRVIATFGNAVAIWGVTPGKDQGNAKKWARMQLGDIAMFYRKRHFFFRGEVAYKIHSQNLARKLWREQADGATWEYIFFLTDLEQIDIDIARFNTAARYKTNNIIQGFGVLTPDHSEAIIEALDLEPPIGAILPTENEIQTARRALEELSGELDLPSTTHRRAEQAILRKIHLGGKKVETCSICAKTLPVDLLVIGHIRKRHSCNASQKRDKANVMPVCLLGCDKLFENGYIYVDSSGAIRSMPWAKSNLQLDSTVSSLEGKACLSWTPASAPYFEWHRKHIRRFL